MENLKKIKNFFFPVSKLKFFKHMEKIVIVLKKNTNKFFFEKIWFFYQFFAVSEFLKIIFREVDLLDF